MSSKVPVGKTGLPPHSMQESCGSGRTWDPVSSSCLAVRTALSPDKALPPRVPTWHSVDGLRDATC